MPKQIPLSKGYRRNKKNEGLFVTVDDADYEWLSQWRWTAHHPERPGGGYAMRIEYKNGRGSGKTLYMHRVIMNPPEGFELVTMLNSILTINQGSL